MTQQNAILVEGIVKRFGDLTALDGIDLQVPSGTVLWVCYPKPGKLETDLGRDKLWMWMKGRGFEPVKVVSVDDTWSAFSFRK